MCERRGDGPLREKRAERFALVEAECSDVDETDNVRCLAVERGHDLATVRVSDNDGWTVLEFEHLAQPGDVVGQRVQRKLGCPDLKAVGLQALDDGAPAGPVRPCAMNENDVRTIAHFSHSLLLLVDAVHATSSPCREKVRSACRSSPDRA